jgi:arylsulfatase A-like enzyme
VHLFEPHSPYEPHDGSPPAVDHRAILAQEPGYPYTEEERAALRGLYRDEVEYTDGQVGALLDGLEAAGKLDNALVIVSADHGESLGEHGIDFNHHGLYDEVLAVPLLVWASNPAFAAGSVVGRQVTVGDIANTLLDFAGVPRLVGTDSLPLTTHLSGTMAGAEVEPRPVLLIGRLVNAMKGGRLLGVRTPVGVKYIQEEGGKELLFDLRDDPAETRDISASEPGAIAAGRENVALLESRMPGELSTEDEQLKALGYKD